MKTDYNLIFEEITAEALKTRARPRLLLHACCAPCSSRCLEVLAEAFDIRIFYYNPNISPEAEFSERLSELRRFLSAVPYPNISVDAPAYDPVPFFEMAAGLENLPEKGERCRKCYELRLRKTAEAARAGGFDYFTTTLSVSPYKNADWLNEIGLSLAEEVGVAWLSSDFKKKNGYRRSIELSEQYGLYRQNYCGCVFSKAEREAKVRAKSGE